ncbi:transcription factor FAMA-like [Cynara cardunculus var. scolymus]|uniref:Myc-type, basic helix-loop-helix (BHLH) domain-containing protein n=1 Tax=Cynara cardunculus var. scolymus TaxID=59895 RepID=A0A103YFY0_CYNCS|nr:transcription factor FAMA-like [Cynara cardunculus var. scolymus]KVI08363.1 Myc-type, basic helix-loop-helix (bHLH) domain-containing protein [Cynara cardunculus var. scolymus]
MLFYSEFQLLQGGFLEFNGDHEHLHQHHQHQQQFMVKNTYENNGNQMVDYLINNPIQHLPSGAGFSSPNSFDKLSFADVMQFADHGPKLALNQNKTSCHDHHDQEDQETGIDPIYFLKFPVLNERLQEDHHHHHQSLLPPLGDDEHVVTEGGERSREEEARVSEGNNMSVRLQFIGDQDVHKTLVSEGKNKRKRPRTIKTSEEVESQRMTHIAVERNRRKQMNEHLRVLRSLMPGSYVQRGDQASIIGGAIEFVRELEQLLQCLESQKRRKLYGDNTPRVIGDSSSLPILQQGPAAAVFYPPPPDDEIKLVEYDGGLKEETAESKSCLADVEVRLLGFDAMIKILCRRRPGQLIKTIAALEDLQLNILHTNITTIEQTVLYSFNVKVTSEVRFSAEDIANSVQQIISFVHENTGT